MTQSDDSNRLIDAGNQERGDNALRQLRLLILLVREMGCAILRPSYMPRGSADAMDHTLLHGPPGLAKQPWHKLLLLNWGLGLGGHRGQ